MTDALKVLSDTPLPTILVIAGLFFILISLADRVMAKIVVPDSRKNSARYMGIALIVFGCGLWVFPTIAGYFVKTPPDGPIAEPNPPTPVPAPAGPYVIQLYALSSFTTAQAAQTRLRVEFPSLLGTLEPQIRSIDDPARGTLYRVSFGTFATVGEADQRCFLLLEKGAEACRPVPKN